VQILHFSSFYEEEIGLTPFDLSSSFDKASHPSIILCNLRQRFARPFELREYLLLFPHSSFALFTSLYTFNLFFDIFDTPSTFFDISSTLQLDLRSISLISREHRRSPQSYTYPLYHRYIRRHHIDHASPSLRPLLIVMFHVAEPSLTLLCIGSHTRISKEEPDWI
jgi:hypothetical protein